jgi:transposase
MKTAGLDVHKDSVFCGVYDGKHHSEVKIFDTFSSSIRQLGEYLKTEGVERVAMESTSIYWIPVWNVLSEMDFDLMLVNPFLIKQLPGRKSDVKDAQWIAQLLHKDMLRGSFIPNELIVELRSYTRTYIKLKQKTTRSLIKMENILVQSSIRLSSLVTHIGGKSMINVIEALIKGETDPHNLAKLVYANKKSKENGKLIQALTGCMKSHHRLNLEMEKEEYDLILKQTQKYLDKIEFICQEYYQQQMDLLKTIPGISTISAAIVIAETGADMKTFENSGKLSGWVGLRPKNDESAGKYKSTAITKGNKYLKPILVQIAWAAARTKGSYFKEKFNRLAMRKSAKKALIAIGRKITVVIWHVLNDNKPYNPALVIVHEPTKLNAKIRYHQKEIERIEKLK